ncbi:VOC family protein [Micromonospora purpureochromogenes]|uniref:VOC family protein n=1 Tax=Micromonospora purpureochromogenes TaxID=47872 RepID=UPI0034080706
MDVNLEVVTIPVSDVDRALEFYRDRLGWRLDADIKVSDDVRIVQVTPTGDGHTSIAFGKGLPIAAAPGSMRHLELVTSDVVATREELAQRGVDVSEVYHGPVGAFWPEARQPGPDPERQSYNSFASFQDPDGNGWTLQEITTRMPGREARS